MVVLPTISPPPPSPHPRLPQEIVRQEEQEGVRNGLDDVGADARVEAGGTAFVLVYLPRGVLYGCVASVIIIATAGGGSGCGGLFAEGTTLDLEAGDDEGERVCEDVGDGGAGGAGDCVAEGGERGAAAAAEYVAGFVGFLDLVVEVEGVLRMVSEGGLGCWDWGVVWVPIGCCRFLPWLGVVYQLDYRSVAIMTNSS